MPHSQEPGTSNLSNIGAFTRGVCQGSLRCFPPYDERTGSHRCEVVEIEAESYRLEDPSVMSSSPTRRRSTGGGEYLRLPERRDREGGHGRLGLRGHSVHGRRCSVFDTLNLERSRMNPFTIRAIASFVPCLAVILIGPGFLNADGPPVTEMPSEPTRGNLPVPDLSLRLVLGPTFDGQPAGLSDWLSATTPIGSAS